jgi:hypothetical protein
MSVFGRSRGPWGSSLAAWEASGGVRRGPGRPPKAIVHQVDSAGTRVKCISSVDANLSVSPFGGQRQERESSAIFLGVHFFFFCGRDFWGRGVRFFCRCAIFGGRNNLLGGCIYEPWMHL